MSDTEKEKGWVSALLRELSAGKLPQGENLDFLWKVFLDMGAGVPNPLFDRSDASERFSETPDSTAEPDASWTNRKLRSLSRSHDGSQREDDSEREQEIPSKLLTANEEKSLFLRYNYSRRRLRGALENAREDWCSKKIHPSVARDLAEWFSIAASLEEKIAAYFVFLVLGRITENRQECFSPTELFFAGAEGLRKAIKHFDVSKECRLGTFARKWIDGAIKAEIKREAKLSDKGKRSLVIEEDNHDPFENLEHPEPDAELPEWFKAALQEALQSVPASLLSQLSRSGMNEGSVMLSSGLAGALARRFFITGSALSYASGEVVRKPPSPPAIGDGERSILKTLTTCQPWPTESATGIPRDWRLTWFRRCVWVGSGRPNS